MHYFKKTAVFVTVVLIVLGFGIALLAEEMVKINIKTASVEELTKLDRIGPKYAQKIVDYREKNGPFEKPEDITMIPGIGPKLADRIVTFRESSGGFKDVGELRKIRGLRAKKVASAAQFVEIRALGKNQ